MNDTYEARGIKLTIGIPTYNGGETIEQTIKSVLENFKEVNTECVELLISDNASTDNTSEIVLKYKSMCRFIRYFRNNENFGGCKNINLVFERAKGDFVWLLGDDDRIGKGGIKRVLDIISKHKDLAYIFVNLSRWNRDFSVCYEKKFLNLDRDVIINDSNRLFFMLRQNAAFTPTQIINRKLWLEIDRQKESHLFDNTGWKTLFYLFLLVRNNKAYIIHEPYALFADGSKRHHTKGSFYNQIIELVKLFEYLPKIGYSKELSVNLLKGILKVMPLTIIYSKYYGLRLKKELFLYSSKVLGKYLIFWIVFLPILLLPTHLVRILLLCYQRCRTTLKKIKLCLYL